MRTVQMLMPGTESICLCCLFTTPCEFYVRARLNIHGAFPFDRWTGLTKKDCVFLTSRGTEDGRFITGSSVLSNITALRHFFSYCLYILNPSGWRTASVFSQTTLFLRAGVETNIRCDRIWHLIFIWHCEGEGSAMPLRKRRAIHL